MDGRELKRLAMRSCQLRNSFRGVFAVDSFSRLVQTHEDSIEGAFVVNQSPRRERGSHWLSVYIHRGNDGARSVVFFDSLGQGAPWEVGVRVPVKTSLVYNTFQVQPDSSTICGLYSLYVLHWLTVGVDFRDVMSAFSPGADERNEHMMSEFAASLKNGLFLCQ